MMLRWFPWRGLINTRAIQNNLDWIWPYWIERQFAPRDATYGSSDRDPRGGRGGASTCKGLHEHDESFGICLLDAGEYAPFSRLAGALSRDVSRTKDEGYAWSEGAGCGVRSPAVKVSELEVGNDEIRTPEAQRLLLTFLIANESALGSNTCARQEELRQKRFLRGVFDEHDTCRHYEL